MRVLDGDTAYANLVTGIRDKSFRYPTKTESAYRNGYILPKITPSFSIRSDQKIFTIGSCFAREIEIRLIKSGFDLPVTKFSLPDGEFPYAVPHMLNEYNAGTILQRIESTFGGFSYTDEMGIEETSGGFIDLFLHVHSKPVSKERLIERRREISLIYDELKSSSVLVITLGLIEAWYDQVLGCYLNKAPSKFFVRANPGRFVVRRLDFEDVYAGIKSAISLVNLHAKMNILLTVSPVPMEATFSGNSALSANNYSKAVLRAAAQILSEEFDNVDYFPSYEIATSRGTGSFAQDNVHVSGETVDVIMLCMYENYVDEQVEAAIESLERVWTFIDRDFINLIAPD